MPWHRTDDGYGDHPKTQATRLADLGRLHLLRVWCCRHLTDGWFSELTAREVGRYARSDDAHRFLTRCSRMGWLDAPAETGGLWRVHDFLDYNPSAEKVRAERDSTAARQRRHYRKAKTPNGVRGTVRDEDPNGAPDPTPSLKGGEGARALPKKGQAQPPKPKTAWDRYDRSIQERDTPETPDVSSAADVLERMRQKGTL